MDYDSRARFGEIIARALKLGNRTQEQVAEEAGVSRKTLSNIINGKTVGQGAILASLAKALSSELHQLQIETITERARTHREAKYAEEAWIELTAMARAINLAKDAIENGTFDELSSGLQEDLGWAAEKAGAAPRLLEVSKSLSADLDVIRHWLSVARDGAEIVALPGHQEADDETVAALDHDEPAGAPEEE